MQSYYKPIGDKKQGFKLTVPASVSKSDLFADNYKLTVHENGALLYTPVRT